MTEIDDKVAVLLGFRVEDKQVKTLEMRVDSFNNKVPVGVRPATWEEIAMWEALVAAWSSAHTTGAWACDNFDKPRTCAMVYPLERDLWCPACKTNPRNLEEKDVGTEGVQTLPPAGNGSDAH